MAEVLGEGLDPEEAADMIVFANEMAGASGDDIDFPAYVQLVKSIMK